MNFFIDHLLGRNYQKRNVAFIENGSWAVCAGKIMKGKFKESNLTFANQSVSIKSALCERSMKEIDLLANELVGYKRIKK